MSKLPDKSVDMVLCDLPYGTSRCKWDVVIPFGELWSQLNRISKPTTPIVMTATQPFTSLLVCSNLKAFRYDLVWEKTAATGHLNAKKMPMRAHESILVFYRKLPTYVPIKTVGHVRKTSVAERFRLGSELYGKERGTTMYDSTERYPRSVLRFASDKQTSCLHPTQKPVALMEYLVKTYSNVGDTILDPTMGSGTVKVVCDRLNRNFIGIENNEAYFKIAQERKA
jgi:site-specific DNA-methyltransferase (adenine-specific)